MYGSKEDFYTLSNYEARVFVDRISSRALENWDVKLGRGEKEAMAHFFEDVGVQAKHLICIDNLADEYIVNSETITQEELEEQGRDASDALFTYFEDNTEHYVMSW